MTFTEFEKKYLKPYGFRYIKNQKGSHVLYENPQGVKFGFAKFHSGNRISDKCIMRFERKVKYNNLKKIGE